MAGSGSVASSGLGHAAMPMVPRLVSLHDQDVRLRSQIHRLIPTSDSVRDYCKMVHC